MPPRAVAPEAVDTLFRALAHRTRREILLVLHFRGGRMTAGEIAERFSCRWPTVTRHLGVLEKAGLIRARKRGRERIYRLDRRRLLANMQGWSRWFKTSARAPSAG